MTTDVVWLVATLKGGVRKTTTAMMLSFAMAKLGFETLVIDADTGTQGVTDWANIYFAANPDGELPMHIAQWSHKDGLLIPAVRHHIKRTGATLTIIDVGGEAPDVLKDAARIATRVISPVGPDQAELGRIAPTLAVVRSVTRAPLHALLTRVPSVGVGIAAGARDYLVPGDPPEVPPVPVLATEIPHNRARYENVWGTSVTDPGAYADVADELVKLEEAQ